MFLLKRAVSALWFLILLLPILAYSDETTHNANINDILTWSGDFRYRHETTDMKIDPVHRQRQRIRFRFGVAAQVSDEFKVNLRLSSGETSNSVSGNQTLGDSTSGEGESRKVVWLETADFEWKPIQYFSFYGGKFGFPLLATDLIFSPELSYEGGLAKSEFTISKSATMFVNLGESWLRENAHTNDQGLMLSQFGIRGNCPDWSYMVGVGYYDFTNVKNQPLFFKTACGNSVDTVHLGSTTYAGYAYDYNLFNSAVRVEWNRLPVPVAVIGEYVKNTEVTNQNSAWLMGIQIGKAKQKKDWSLYYSYRVIQKDAAIGSFTEPNFGNGGTSTCGHKVDIEYIPVKNISAALHLFDNTIDPDHANVAFKRLQIEIMFRF